MSGSTDSDQTRSENLEADPTTPAAEVTVVVYRSERRADTYVYLPQGDDFEDLPDPLRKHFGAATPFLDFVLHSQKHLAQADPVVVLRAIAEQGFYLQLPPQKDEL